MKRLAQIALSATLALVMVSGASIALTGCSADTLSGPSIEAYGSGDGDAIPGSGHNNGVTGGDGDAIPGSGHNNGKSDGGDGDAIPGSGHNNG